MYIYLCIYIYLCMYLYVCIHIYAYMYSVYVAMGGAVFAHDACRRDTDSGAFLPLAPFAPLDKVCI